MTHPRAARLSGLLTAIATPFDSEGNLALQHVPALLEEQRQAGIDGVVVCGTNGEGTSLSVDERCRVLEAFLEQKGEMLVVAGTGAASVTDTVALTKHAARAGADGVLTLPPFFFKNPPAQGIANAFLPALDAADIPMLLYHIPQMSAVPITEEVIGLLQNHPNLAGLKDSTGSPESALNYIRTFPNLRIFPGSDRLILLAARNGAAGSISGGGNAFPHLVAAARRAALGSDEAAAESAQQKVDVMMDILTRFPGMANNKSVMALRGMCRLSVRPPLVNLTPQQEQSLRQMLLQAGLLSA